MTFAQLRSAVLLAGPLSTDQFAEQVTRKKRDGTESTPTVKIEMETKPRRTGDKPAAMRQRDESQRIRVMVSRAAGAYTSTPEVGETITRASSRDPDTRPWSYLGEIVAESELHAVYVYERARRQVDSRAVEQV